MRTKEILLSQGAVTIVDEEDYERLMRRNWYLSDYGYAVAHRKDKSRSPIRMAREIMNCSVGMEVDHINRDKLDNRKVNLRVVSKKQNVWNTGPRVTSHTGVKGVGWHKRIGKYHARVNHDGKMYHFGYFDSVHEAAHVYNIEIKKLRGEFGALAEV